MPDLPLKSIFCILALCLFLTLPPAHAASRVVTAEVSNDLPAQQLRLTGDLLSEQFVSVANEISGQVDGIFIEAGDEVTQGQALVSIRSKKIKLELEEARALLKSDKASVELAEQEQQRLKKLLETKAVPIETYDQAVTRHEKAIADMTARKAAIKNLEDSLERHQVVAPFAGTIVNRHVEIGAWVGSGEPVVDLVNHHQLRLKLAVPQQYYTSILAAYRAEAPRINAQIVMQDGNRKAMNIERIIAVANNQRNFGLWLNVDNDGQWLPGMSLTAEINWKPAAEGMSVPEDALIRKADGSIIVWKVQADGEIQKVMPAPVKTLYSVGETTVITSEALAVGDSLVIRGNETLKPGQAVEVIAPQ